MKYYVSPASKSPKGEFSVRGCSCGPATSLTSTYANAFQVVTPKRTYFMCGTPEDYKKWRQAIIEHGGNWEEALLRRATILHDGTIIEPDISKYLQDIFVNYRNAVSFQHLKRYKANLNPESGLEGMVLDPPLEQIVFLFEKISGTKGELFAKTNSGSLVPRAAVITFVVEDNEWKVDQEEWIEKQYIKERLVDEFQQAVVEGNQRRVSQILNSEEVKPNDQAPKSFETPLTTAIKNSDVKMATLLLKKGADPNARSSYGDYPIFIALQSQNETLVRSLIKAGADLKVRNSNGKTPEEYLDEQISFGLTKDRIQLMKGWLKR